MIVIILKCLCWHYR